MATTTTNYELTKAGYNDIPDIETINDNMDTLDSSLVVGESNDDALANITKTTGWTNAEPVTLGDKFQSAMTKISTMIKNLKWIYKFIGSTDISSIGDGTITNAISTLSSNKLNASDVKTSLTDTSTAHALSTASGKALNDAITPLKTFTPVSPSEWTGSWDNVYATPLTTYRLIMLTAEYNGQIMAQQMYPPSMIGGGSIYLAYQDPSWNGRVKFTFDSTMTRCTVSQFTNFTKVKLYGIK